MIVRVTPDMKSYTSWVVDTNGQQIFGADGLPVEALNATRTTSKSTLGTNVQNEMPTLGT
jgi:hypothetical protein